MTTKADFNAEEWSLLQEGPALAGLMVVTAERGGLLRESLSMAQAYGEARRQGGNELLDELVSSPPQLDPKRFRSPDEVQGQALQRLGEAVELLESKGTAEEADAYKRFALDVAERVAGAAKEGGFLGIGGKRVSENENAALDQLAGSLGIERSAETGPASS
jgi:hypothetical protein